MRQLNDLLILGKPKIWNQMDAVAHLADCLSKSDWVILDNIPRQYHLRQVTYTCQEEWISLEVTDDNKQVKNQVFAQNLVSLYFLRIQE